ncbi:MAG TPA: hypothetical protein VG860_02050 [Terriglobia bacterium]|nr:hypothetical protein [Terriglobia bacterium]
MKQKHRIVRAPGLILPRRVMRLLMDAGIYAEAGVTMEHQDLAKRYVVRGVESGGATEEIGRYVTFTDENGHQLSFLHPLDSIGLNGVHAVVVAPVLVRVEMFRARRTYRLLISCHRPGTAHDGRPPSLESRVVFDGADGYLDLELWKRDRALAGTVLPRFYSRAGEETEVPEVFRSAVMATTKGAACVRCTHGHYLLPRTEPVAAALVTAPLQGSGL